MKSLLKNFALIIAAAVILSHSNCFAVSKTASTRPSTAWMMQQLNDLPAIKKLSPWTNPYGPGVIITTAHYNIHTTLYDPLMLRQAPSFMESAYQAYNSQLPFPIDTRTRFTIYLFADRSQWESFTRSFAGSSAPQYINDNVGAYFLNGACVAYNIGRKKTFGILGHEGWHQFNNKHFTYRLPSWLDEGLATLFEVSEPVKGKFVFNPSGNYRMLQNLQYTIISYNMIPLEDLIRLNPGQVIGAHYNGQSNRNEQAAVSAYYSQCYALARFLREEGYGKRINKFHSMMLGGLNGTWPLEEQNIRMASDRNIPMSVGWNSYISPKLFDLYIQEDPKQLQREYEAFCKKIVYDIRISTSTKTLK